MVDHSAGGPLAGYVWPIRRALIALLRSDCGSAIELEARDDLVCFNKDGIVALFQFKHSYDRHTLTVESYELWSALRVWLDTGEPAGTPAHVRLVLWTTYRLSDKADLLHKFAMNPDGATTPSDRDVHALADALTALATAGSNRSLSKSYLAWPRASGDAQTGLLRKLRIVHSQQQLAGTTSLLTNELTKFVPPEHRDAFAESLVGWFQLVVDERLKKRGCRVTRDELQEKIYALIKSVPSAHSLSLFGDSAPPDMTAEIRSNPTYVKQLQLIGASQDAVALAAQFRYRANSERDRIRQDNVSGHAHLAQFDTDLTDHWGTVFSFRPMSMSPEDQGMVVLDKCLQYSTALIGRAAPRFLLNGTYHELAEGLVVGWHPNFKSLLSRKGEPDAGS